MMSRSSDDDLASLLSAFDELGSIDDVDTALRHAVEVARHHVGLQRVGVFLLDEPRNVMLGAWGTDLRGAIVDEHHVMYEVGESDREVFRRASVEGARFTVYENCPIVVQRKTETVVAGRGWVACTPIYAGRERLGMLFNDAGLTGAPVDDAKQTRLAILSSLLGTLLDNGRGHTDRRELARVSGGNPMALRAARLLASDPSLGGKEIAAKLDISLSRLARVFKADMGMSLVAYRNHLRLERFSALVEEGGGNLLEAALAAGFGSYAQFHRVFRAMRGTTPRDFMRDRGS